MYKNIGEKVNLAAKIFMVLAEIAWLMTGIYLWGGGLMNTFLFYAVVVMLPVGIVIFYSSCLLQGLGEILEKHSALTEQKQKLDRLKKLDELGYLPPEKESKTNEPPISLGLCALSAVCPVFGIVYRLTNYKRAANRTEACAIVSILSLCVCLLIGSIILIINVAL